MSENITRINSDTSRGRGKPNEAAAVIEDMTRRGGRIWEQLPGEVETDHAYQKFQEYRDLGPSRSLAKLAQALGYEGSVPPGSLLVLSNRYHWQQRVSAFDSWVRETKDKAFEQALDHAAKSWAERQVEARERQYKIGSAVVGIIEARVMRAQGIEIDKDGVQHEVEVEPLVIADKDLPRFLNVACAIMNEAIAATTPGGSGDGSAATLPSDWAAEASDADLLNYLNKIAGKGNRPPS